MKEIEQAAENYYANNVFCDGITDFEKEIALKCFVAGAKWQAERMYSEEHLKIAHFMGAMFAYARKEVTRNDRLQHFEEWFEQFKKR